MLGGLISNFSLSTLGVAASWGWGLIFLSPLLILAYRNSDLRKQIVVSSTYLLKKLTPRKRPTKRIRPPWTALLELLALILLGILALQPFFSETKQDLVLVLDNSLSMQAENRFSQAITSLTQKIDLAPRNSRFKIFLTSPRLRSLGTDFVSTTEAKSILNGQQLSAAEDSLEPALAEINRNETFDSAFVATDQEAYPGITSRFELLQVGKVQQNFAISDLQVETKADSKRVLNVTVERYASEASSLTPSKISVELIPVNLIANAALRNQLITRREISISTSAQIEFELAQEISSFQIKFNSGQLEDALTLDNTAWGSVLNTASTTALYVGADPNFQTGLGGIKQIKFERLGIEEYENLTPEALTRYAFVIFHKLAPLRPPKIPGLYILPPRDNLIAPVLGTSSSNTLSYWDETSPITAYVKLNLLNLSAAQYFKTPAWLKNVIRSEQGPVLLSGESAGIRFLISGIELLPFEGTVNPVLSVLSLNCFNFLRSAESGNLANRQGSTLIGSSLALSPPSTWVIKDPSGKTTTIEGQVNQTLNFDTPGIYHVTELSGKNQTEITRKNSSYNVNAFFSHESQTAIRPRLSLPRSSSEDKTPELAKTELYPTLTWIIIFILILEAIFRIRSRSFSASEILRVLALCFLVLGLTKPSTEKIDTELSAVALYDVSESVTPKARKELITKVQQLSAGQNNLKIKVIPFAGTTSDKQYQIQDLPEDNLLRAKLDAGRTNLETALSQTRSERTILLLSDGYETSGSIKSLKFDGKSNVYPMLPALESFTDPELKISFLSAPLIAEAEDSAEIQVSLQNTFEATQQGRLEVYLDDKKLHSGLVSITAQSEKTLKIDSQTLAGGLHKIKAKFTPQEVATNKVSEAYRWISVKKKSKVLILSGSAVDARILPRLYLERGYLIESRIPSQGEQAPTNLADYANVILNNIPKTDLSQNFLEELKKYVASGGGLLLVGGDRMYGLGGYENSTLDEISPVKFVPPTTTKKRLNNAVVLILDKSRSMAEENKILSAKEAALVSINALKDDDLISVIGFDTNPFLIIRMDTVAEVKPSAERRLRNLTAAGQTNLRPALAQARRMLLEAKAGRKHIIVLTDGELSGTDQEFIQEAGRINAEGITLSAVALGFEADVQVLKGMAGAGKGAFYHVLNQSNLPEIFLQDIKVTTGDKTLKENQEFPVFNVNPVSLKVGPNYPPLLGFVETRQKDSATLELQVSKDEERFPLLASWNYGQGKVIAYTSDAHGRWSSPWVPWRDFVNFWSNLLDAIKPIQSNKDSNTKFDLRTAIQADHLQFDLTLFDQALVSQKQNPEILITDPQGKSQTITLRETIIGRYQGNLENVVAGDYKLNIKYGKTELPPLAVTVQPDAFGEKQGAGINAALLQELARKSGGKINPQLEDLQDNLKQIITKSALYPYFALAAFLLILVQAFWRETFSPQQKALK